MSPDEIRLADAQLDSLRKVLDGLAVDHRVAIAYSGGLDSRFLSYTARTLELEVLAFHISGPHVAPKETEEALERAGEMGLTVRSLSFDMTTIDLARSGRERCYVCKHTFFTKLLAVLHDEYPALPLCDGTNASDLAVFRPGRRALLELGVRSPLAEAGLTKSDIRLCARRLGMPDPEQAARPCLLTRFPYGVTPTREALGTVARVEAFLSKRPETAHLRFRLRYPTEKPELHIERASLPANISLDAVTTLLLQAFPQELEALKVRVFDQLSGYYDRPEGM